MHRDQQATILLVEHDLEMVRQLSDRLYVIDAGHMIATGPTADVLAEPAVRRAYQGRLSDGGLAR